MFETKIKKIFLVAALALAASACVMPSESSSGTDDIEETSDETKDVLEEQKSDETGKSSSESADIAEASTECLDLPSDPVACQGGEGVEDSQSSEKDVAEASEDDSNELTGYTDNPEVFDAVIKETEGYVRVSTRFIYFASGESTATVSESVLRANANVHIFNVAKAGQNIQIDISSLENNAWFRVITPSGKVYGDVSVEGLTEFDETSVEGDYAILVTSQRGNASYDLTLEIE